METSIIISGFGGQGALFAGQLLAYAAMDSGKEVTWIPSYGPEMRGGTAHCTVVIGDEPIGAPLVRNPDCVIAMNLPSVDKYESLIKTGGRLVYDSTLVKRTLRRDDISAASVPAHDIALRCGSQQLVNIAMLGALIALCPLVELAAVEQALRTHLPQRHAGLLRPNILALHAGAAYAEERKMASSQN
jgi:2-oxoglutarate ferredoxin oxidoreductase subunit gamma